MLGEYSKHQEVSVTASSGAELSITHTLGETPKLVVINSEVTAGNKIKGFIGCDFCGASRYTPGTSGGGLFYYNISSWESPENARFFWDSTNINIRQSSTTRTWSVGATYTVHIYA